MVTPQNSALSPNPVHKIVQRLSTNAQKPPADAVTIEVLKLMELHLQRRGLIPETVGTNFRYLWFIAETERNIFLWRNGLSISDAENFEFWVIVSELVGKRMIQLGQGDIENPFVNPLWGGGSTSSDAIYNEKQYLDIFQEIYTRSAKHVHAICSMTKMIAKELGRTVEHRVPVIIPWRREER